MGKTYEKHPDCHFCGKNNTYISKNGYDTVVVCKSCHGEFHVPYYAQKEYNERENRK